ncbi:Glyoxalase family protein [Neorhizobium galegae bv. orientalis]|nr:Glyoxalase family protein [Neorhizobium galegae bv. orientalis]
MLDHIGLRTKNVKELVAFYEAALAPLGITKQHDFGVAAGFGRPGEAALWVGEVEGEAAASSVHLAITSIDRASMDTFHATAIAAGASDNGPPGLRPQYHEHYYAAFVIDPDGNNLEVVCHMPE